LFAIKIGLEYLAISKPVLKIAVKTDSVIMEHVIAIMDGLVNNVTK